MAPVVLATIAVALAGTGLGAGTWWALRERSRYRAALARLGRELDLARYAADHDALTGLPNRRAFVEAGEALLARAGDVPVAGIVVDVDEFKVINDTFGHVAGDEVLIVIARRLVAVARDGLVARLGGDEFAGLITGSAADPYWHRDFVERLRRELREPIWVSGQAVWVSVSIGLAPVLGPASLTQVLRAADCDMYRAKAACRAAASQAAAGGAAAGGAVAGGGVVAGDQPVRLAVSTRSMSPGVTASATTARPPLMASATRSAEST